MPEPELQAAPPALTAERKQQIKEALSALAPSDAENALKALESFKSANEKLSEIQHAVTRTRLSVGNAENVIKAVASLAKNISVANASLSSLELKQGWGEGPRPTGKICDLLENNPFEIAINSLTPAIEKFKRDVDKATPQDYDYEHLKTNLQDINNQLAIFKEAGEEYKRRLQPLQEALQDKQVTPDEIIRYNRENKEKVIEGTLKGFIQKQGAGEELSNAQIARSAVEEFKVHLETTKSVNKYPDINNEVILTITALEQMGNGVPGDAKLFSPNTQNTPQHRFIKALEEMERVTNVPGNAQHELRDAKEAFFGATKELRESFLGHNIEGGDLGAYNRSLKEKEAKQEQSFAQQPTKEKIRQFIQDGHHKRYETTIAAIDALLTLNAKGTLPGYTDTTSDPATPSEFVTKNTPFLEKMRAHYKNRLAALTVIAEDRPLTEEQYMSVTSYPVDQSKIKEESSGNGERRFAYEKDPVIASAFDKDMGQKALNEVRALLNNIHDGVRGIDRPLNDVKQLIKVMRETNFGGETPLGGKALIESTQSVEERYGITPENMIEMYKHKEFTVVGESASSMPAPKADAAASGSVIVVAGSAQDDRNLLVTTPAPGELSALTDKFAKKFSIEDRPVLGKSSGKLDERPLERVIAQRLEEERTNRKR